MDVLADMDIAGGMSHALAIFDDAIVFLNLFGGDLMAAIDLI